MALTGSAAAGANVQLMWVRDLALPMYYAEDRPFTDERGHEPSPAGTSGP